MARPDGAKICLFQRFSIFWYRVKAKLYRVNSIHTDFLRRISWEWFWILFSDKSPRKATSKQQEKTHPTPPRRFRISNVMAFPVTGRSHGLAAAPRHGQVALGTNKVALDLGGGPRHFIGPQRHLAMAWHRRQAMGTPSNWERHNIRYR